MTNCISDSVPLHSKAQKGCFVGLDGDRRGMPHFDYAMRSHQVVSFADLSACSTSVPTWPIVTSTRSQLRHRTSSNTKYSSSLHASPSFHDPSRDLPNTTLRMATTTAESRMHCVQRVHTKECLSIRARPEVDRKWMAGTLVNSISNLSIVRWHIPIDLSCILLQTLSSEYLA